MAWTCVKADMSMGEQNRRMVYQVEDGDISTPPDPDYAAVGSVAYMADMSAFWVKDAAGEWTEATADALALISLI